MKTSILFAAIALSAASAGEARVAPAMPQVLEVGRLPAPRAPVASRGFALSGDSANCAITVAFTSYGAGIDGPTRTRMERMLRADRRVRTFTSRPWGREGEVTFCISVRRNAGVYPLSRDLRNMVPRRPRGPIQVQLHPRAPTAR